MASDKKIRVLIIDDSAFMRQIIAKMLEKDKQIEIAGFAKDGEEGMEKLAKLCPDVITLDLQMPKKDGLAFLKEMMELKPTPTIVVSSLATEGAELTLKALNLGALDFLTKPVNSPSAEIYNIEEELINKVITFAGINLELIQQEKNKIRKPVAKHVMQVPPLVTVIGSSTGGPRALEKIIRGLPSSYPTPVVIAQHMPPGFTAAFAKRLNDCAKMMVKEASHGEKLLPSTVYIAPSGFQTTIVCRDEQIFAHVGSEPKRTFRPCVDVLFESAAESCGKQVLAILLTGMGTDGALGLKKLHDLGAWTIAESEESCVIYGMPKAAIEMDAAKEIVSLRQIAEVMMNRASISESRVGK